MPHARVLHIGKFMPPKTGGMERFLFGLLAAAHDKGQPVAALVHTPAGTRSSKTRFPFPVFSARYYGQFVYAPVSPAFPAALSRAIRDFRPDILHLHLPNTSAFALLLSPAARRLPWVVQWQSDVVASQLDRRLAWAYGLYRPFERSLLARSARIVVSTRAYLESSEPLGAWRDRTTVIPLGIDPEKWPEPSDESIEGADSIWGPGFRVLAVGRLAYYKGFDVLVRAVADVPGARLLLIGDGPEKARLQKAVRECGVSERVSLLGFLTDDAVAPLLATADVICVPSLERTESFGVVALEAMCDRKAIVATDIPGSGLGWVVREAGAGLLVPPGNVRDLASALEQLKNDSALRHDLGLTGGIRLRQRFHIRRVLEELNVVYADVLGG